MASFVGHLVYLTDLPTFAASCCERHLTDLRRVYIYLWLPPAEQSMQVQIYTP